VGPTSRYLLLTIYTRCDPRCSVDAAQVKVDPQLDLDGPQLAYAAKFDNLLTFDIGLANNWYPRAYADLPEQLQPVRAAQGRLSALSVSLLECILYGAFVWAHRALNGRKCRFPARAVGGWQSVWRPPTDLGPQKLFLGPRVSLSRYTIVPVGNSLAAPPEIEMPRIASAGGGGSNKVLFVWRTKKP
jgi:hypothetical protein